MAHANSYLVGSSYKALFCELLLSAEGLTLPSILLLFPLAQFDFLC